MMTETWVAVQPDTDEYDATYRWERGEGWSRDMNFDEGQAICIDPYDDFWLPIYCTFREYVTDGLAKVYVPSMSENAWPIHWFEEPEGEYIIHEGYLTPQ